MKIFANSVVEFNKDVLGIEKRKKSLLPPPELNQTTKCLREEIDEFEKAHSHGDFVEGVDALMDLMYFAIGGLYRMGLSPEEMDACWKVIHECNMNKQIGVVPRRGDGSSPDAVKPDGWKGPEEKIAEILGGSL